MLTSEFNNEIGTLVRSLQQRVVMEPALMKSQYTGSDEDAIENLDRTIVTLIALRVSMMQRRSDAT